MKKILIDVERPYPMYIGCGIINKLSELLSENDICTKDKLVIITDTNVGVLYGDRVITLLTQQGYSVEIIVISAGEDSKNIRVIEKVIGQCLQWRLDRQGVILSLGGGVVGDIAGFIASIYMRGIRYVHISTTILSHDSSIGGKVGVNHELGKNTMGAFYHPKFILFDTGFLATLPRNEIISGYAEIIKHALIRDEGLVRWLEKNSDLLLSLNIDTVEEALFRSCRIKAAIVSQDEQEKGLRKILNYGHTIGHALETVTRYNEYTHGEAVAIGLRGAAYLGDRHFNTDGYIEVQTVSLLNAFQLPTTLRINCSNQDILAAMERDKKQMEGRHTFILSSGIGKAEIVEVHEEDIVDAFRKIRIPTEVIQ